MEAALTFLAMACFLATGVEGRGALFGAAAGGVTFLATAFFATTFFAATFLVATSVGTFDHALTVAADKAFLAGAFFLDEANPT